MTDFSYFFSPRSLALFGASRDPRKWGYRVMSNIVGGGFQGNIFPINPKGGEILGVRVYRTLQEVPQVPDLAIIAVPPIGMLDAIKDCVIKGIKAGVVITAGFAEVDKRGALLQSEMAELARSGGMRLVGPNCFGLMSATHKLYAQMPNAFPPSGSLAVVSQSGNVGFTVAYRAMSIDFGCSRVISTGNEADLHAEDFIEYLSGDEQTKVILSYIEGFKDGRRFFNISREVSRKKPIVMIKVGGTEAGAAAARSHTAALSGSDKVFEGICRQAGIIRVRDLQELINVGYGFLSQPLPKGRRVGIVTGGGGWGVLGADAAARLGLDVVKLPDDVFQELDSFLPAWWSRNNPIDLVAGAPGDAMIRIIEILARCEKIDSVIALGSPVIPQEWTKPAFNREEQERIFRSTLDQIVNSFQKVKDISEKYGKPVIIAAEFPIPGGNFALRQEIKRRLSHQNMTFYDIPDEAAMVLNALVRYSEFIQKNR